MKSNLKKFLVFVRNYGLGNTLMLALFKVFPKQFSLLSRSLITSGGLVHKDSVAVDYSLGMGSVYDFAPWDSCGGALQVKSKIDDRVSFIWFVPDWTNVWGGGHYTLFRFANHFAKSGTRNIIYIYDNQRHRSPVMLQNELNNALKDCKLEVIVDPWLLPECSGAIATTWQSAYHVRAFSFANKKFYFMQDYESLFYAFGTASMQANATYAFGFTGITGGGWLKRCYESHGGKALNYLFAADKNIFYPSTAEGLVAPIVGRLFFYGRPSTERRCFELGMAALKKISDKYPNVEIVIAGLDLKFKPPFKATLLGNMKLEDTGILYRTCDIGMAFSGTNLSYLPVELMASGVPVISNNGPHVEWHCKHLENCYLVEPTPQSVLDAFSILYDDRKLRQKLAEGGLSTMKNLTWDNEMTKIYDYVSSNL